VYILSIVPRETQCIHVGKHGSVDFDASKTYVYVGSALSGLARRLDRHVKTGGKKLHWHVDYLLQHARITMVHYAITMERKECELASRLGAYPGEFVPVEKFGNSDCRECPSHLYAYAKNDDTKTLDAVLRATFERSGLHPVAVLAPSN
jgi:Uri superfamily endonuclease